MSYNLPSLSLAAPMLKWPGFEMPLPVVSKLMVSVCPSLCWPLGTWCHRGAVRGDAATARLPAPALHALRCRCTHPGTARPHVPVPVAGAPPHPTPLPLHGSSHRRALLVSRCLRGAPGFSPSSCCSLPCSRPHNESLWL